MLLPESFLDVPSRANYPSLFRVMNSIRIASVHHNKNISELKEHHQLVLELLSIIYQPIAATPLAQCATKALLIDPATGNPWTSRAIGLALSELANEGWAIENRKRYSIPSELIEDITLHSIKQNHFQNFADVIQSIFATKKAFSGKRVWSTWESAVADSRICLYKGDYLDLKSTLDDIHSQFQYTRKGSDYPYPDIFGDTPKQKQLSILSDEIFTSSVAPYYTSYASFRLDNIDEFWNEMLRRQETVTDETQADILNTLIAEQSLVRGDASKFPPKPKNNYYAALWFNTKSCQMLLQGDSNGSFTQYEQGVNLLRKSTKQRSDIYFGDIFESFHLLTQLALGMPDANNKAISAHNKLHKSFVIYYLLIAYADSLATGDDTELRDEIELLPYSEDAFILLFILLIAHWSDVPTNEKWLEQAEAALERASNHGYHWFAAEFSQALSLLLPKTDERKEALAEQSHQLHEQTGTTTLFALIKPQLRWERSLNALNMLGDVVPDPKNDKVERLIWILEQDESEWDVQAKLQKQTKSGSWSKGRNIALVRLLKEQELIACLSEEDKRICASIREDNTYYVDNQPNYRVDMELAWPALIEHPRIFWDKTRNTPLEIHRGEIELLVTEEGDEIRVNLYPEVNTTELGESHFMIHKETPTRLRVYRVNEQHEKIIHILGQGLLMPKEAEPALRETLGTLAPMLTIQSDITGMDDAVEIEVDSRIHIHLLPYGDGLRLSMRVQPFGENKGTTFPPAHGRKNPLLEIDGQKTKTRRDIEQELKNAEAILDSIDVLSEWDNFEDEIVLDKPNDALEALTGLHEFSDGIVLEWPEGEVMRITGSVDSKNMRLNVNEQGEWFELDGEVTVNENLIMSLGQLLELSKKNQGRFIKLGEGQYVTLTKNLQRKLQAINAFAEQNDDDKVKLSSLAALALEDFISEAEELGGDGKWQENIQRLKNINNEHYEVPSTLQTDLRDYQEEGFRWMARLAEWGVGACLADDMGLGKTIQALALILTRASSGPTLVIAPVSVCNNWYSETLKFAPTLNPIFYRGKERKEILTNIKPYDLIICSYGLLPNDADFLTKIQWNTVLLDEAQAIKNVSTKRTRAAWDLPANFRLITTGTPIENHLGELWSLFRFLNPGLLGTQEHFIQHYMSPIERYSDKNASENLRKIIQPFLLRRTKTQVLKELPPRTEITYKVPLSADERALYEAVRQNAMQKLSDNQKDGKNTNHIQVLAEITKLRLASCHPKLVMPTSNMVGSKLQAFGEIVEELIENKHKALVFSQFVKHLSILREYLDEKGIHYQYLDGSTPQTKRQKAVESFQDGQGDIFLISLKAGGSGLNLTAADYVIHMDPWWNPAVEDQASDRAHRMGQLRPVTIYRLVAENTIEEKIVKLHQHKRDLADTLLEGSDMSGKMTAAQMLSLIQED